MYLKLVLFVALVSICTSISILGYDKYFIRVDYDSIYIRDVQNHEVKICTNKLKCPYMEIYVTGPEGYVKTLKVKDIQVGYGGDNQSDILYQIFKPCEGEVDRDTYLRLLDIVEKFVELKKVSPIVLNCLQILCCQDQDKNILLGPYTQTYQPYQKYYRPHGDYYSSNFDLFKTRLGGYDDLETNKYGKYSDISESFFSPYSYNYQENAYEKPYVRDFGLYGSSRDVYGNYDKTYDKIYKQDNTYRPYDKTYYDAKYKKLPLLFR